MGKAIRILVIDDEAIVGTRLKASLEKTGWEVTTFTNSTEALKTLKEKSFDVVITDFKMPNVNGMEIFRFVKEKWPQTKIIMISGFATVETAREALKEGVSDFLAKPFRISQLKEAIFQAVGQKQLKTV